MECRLGNTSQGSLPVSFFFMTGVALDRSVENARRTLLSEFSFNLPRMIYSAAGKSPLVRLGNIRCTVSRKIFGKCA
jgi:hypothetical protein